MLDFIYNNSLILLLLLGCSFTVFWLMRHRQKLDLAIWAAVILGILHTVVGVLCVKVFAVIETFDFSNIGNMSLFGAVFFLPVTYWAGAKLFKRNVAEVFDTFTPCVVFTLMCARVNCLISGCCLGAYISGTEGLRFPTRELEIAFYIGLLIYFFMKDKKTEKSGLLYPLYMSLYGGFRFITEFFRNSESPSLFHISHIWAALAFIVGYSLYVELKNKKQKIKNKK